jgi:outer membrane receptor protein involved in Fe transport
MYRQRRSFSLGTKSGNFPELLRRRIPIIAELHSRRAAHCERASNGTGDEKMQLSTSAKLQALWSALACVLGVASLDNVAHAVDSDAATNAPADQSTVEFPTVKVVEITPLDGVGQSKNQIAAPVQTATSEDIKNSNATDLTEFMNRKLGGVYFNEVQGNPLQPDVNFRGYTASPLLGTPQGLSVYMDGVRLNQPFGDVVSWDLIPRSAISSIALMPGSNPLFGLNTLGGALSIQTKSGRTDPGTTVEATYGSHARGSANFQTGGSDGAFDWYVNAHYFTDNGWREYSPTDQGQFFSKFGWHDDRTDLNLSYAYVKDSMVGNGLQDQRLLHADYNSVYTIPDSTKNESNYLNLEGKHSFNDAFLISGNAYYRRIKTNTENGDLNDDAIGESVYQPSAAEQAALTAAGYSGFPTSGANAANTPFPKWRCIANALLNSEPNEKCDGLDTRTHTTQENYGVGAQLNWASEFNSNKNNFIFGAAYDANRIAYQQAAQFGYLNPNRSITLVDGPGAFADGSQDSENAFDSRVDLKSGAHTWSVFLSDTLTFADVWNLTVSGRYNRQTVNTHDLLDPDGGIDSLNGHDTYSRFNPAVGLTWSPTETINAYVGYNEGNRAPSAVELGCANEDNPCRLPNAMAGDPPLAQVVTRTLEAGLRGTLSDNTHWNASVYRAENKNDILFVAAPDVSGAGFFQNFPKTRRQGFDLGFDSKLGDVKFGGNYSYVDATYRAYGLFPGDANSSNSFAQQDPAFRGLEGGTIEVKPGDHLPLIPKQTLKLFAEWQATDQLTLNLDFDAFSGSYARGNENNQDQPDGIYYLGPGKTAGYGVFDFGANFKATPKLEFFAQISNLLDRHYYTSSLLGSTGFDANGNFHARPFPAVANAPTDENYPAPIATYYAPGAPRLIWGGFRYTF